MNYGTGSPKAMNPTPPPKLNVLHESKRALKVAATRIRNSREIMTQLPGLTVATQVEDYLFLNIRALLTTALFAGGGYGELQMAWRRILGLSTRVLLPASEVKLSNRCAPFDITLR
jgi:hypothetical protein